MLFERTGELTALCIQMASDQNNYTQRHPRISQRRNVRTIFSIALHHEDCHIATNTWVFMHACSVIRVGLVAELSYGGIPLGNRNTNFEGKKYLVWDSIRCTNYK